MAKRPVKANKRRVFVVGMLHRVGVGSLGVSLLAPCCYRGRVCHRRIMGGKKRICYVKLPFTPNKFH